MPSMASSCGGSRAGVSPSGERGLDGLGGRLELVLDLGRDVLLGVADLLPDVGVRVADVVDAGGVGVEHGHVAAALCAR